MLGFFKKHSESQGPYVTDITVNPALRKGLGFKTELSTFYLISDEWTAEAKTLDKDSPCAGILKKRPKFRGVYCEPGIENVMDIRFDLSRYCALTKQFGLVMLNGKEFTQSPDGKVGDYQPQKEL